MAQTNIEKYESLLSKIDREGMDKLLVYIRKSDFYTAPASTRYHSCHEGGLLEHSLNVMETLLNKRSNPIWSKILDNVGEESLILCSLLHDICKTNYYIVEPRNKKVYSDEGKKIDSKGKYDWVVVNGYTVDDKAPYGHGEKSVMMIESFIKLAPVERYAIRWHMGWTEPKENWNYLSAAIKKYPFILALHEADIESTYLLEEEE